MGHASRQSKFSRFSKAFWHFFALPKNTRSGFGHSKLKNSKGSALIMAAIFMMVATVLVSVGMTLVNNQNKQSRQQELYVNEAKNAALAGLQDAKGWFIRQANQPVAAAVGFAAEPSPQPTFAVNPTMTPIAFKYTYVDQAFNPAYNSTNPMLGDTMNSTIAGIVNEFSPYGASVTGQTNQAAGNVSAGGSNNVIWDRYEVDQQSNSAVTNPYAVHDISGERVNDTHNGSGLVWTLVSTGTVYRRMDFNKINSNTDWLVAYNQSPNVVLATAKMQTEIRKLSVQNPFNVGAAVYLEYLNQLNISSGTGILVSGFNKKLYFGAAGVTASTGCGAVAGSNSTNFPDPATCVGPVSINSQLLSNYVFGMSVTDISTISDIQGSSGPNTQILNINNTQNFLSYYNGNLTFDPASATPQYQDLTASGILVVNGSLTITSNTTQTQLYNGIVFVTGNLTLNGGIIDGEVIMGSTGAPGATAGNVYVNAGPSGSPSQIIYDPTMVTTVIGKVGQYREDESAKRLLLAVPNL